MSTDKVVTERASDLYQTLTTARALLVEPTQPGKFQNGTDARIVPRGSYSAAIERLRASSLPPAIRAATYEIAAAPWIVRSGQQVLVDPGEWQAWQSKITNIAAALDLAIATLELVHVPRDENTVLVRIPDDVRALDDLAKTVATVSRIINQTALRFSSGTVEFRGVEHGSSWLILAATAPAVLEFIRRLLALFNEYAKERAAIERTRIISRSLEIDNAARAMSATHTEVLLTALNTKYATILARPPKANEPKDAPLPKIEEEAISIARTALKDLWAMTTRGMEVRLQLQAKEKGEATSTRPALTSAREVAQLGAGESRDKPDEDSKENGEDDSNPSESSGNKPG